MRGLFIVQSEVGSHLTQVISLAPLLQETGSQTAGIWVNAADGRPVPAGLLARYTEGTHRLVTVIQRVAYQKKKSNPLLSDVSRQPQLKPWASLRF